MILVSALTQKVWLPFAFGMSGVAVAALEDLLTSTEHGCDGDPQVLAAVHRDAGSGSLQEYDIFFCACAASPQVRTTSGKASNRNLGTLSRAIFIASLHRPCEPATAEAEQQ